MSFTCQQDGLFKSVLPSWTNPNISGCLNIPMYLVGAPHPHKADAQRLLEKLRDWIIFAIECRSPFQERLRSLGKGMDKVTLITVPRFSESCFL